LDDLRRLSCPPERESKKGLLAREFSTKRGVPPKNFKAQLGPILKPEILNCERFSKREIWNFPRKFFSRLGKRGVKNFGGVFPRG